MSLSSTLNMIGRFRRRSRLEAIEEQVGTLSRQRQAIIDKQNALNAEYKAIRDELAKNPL